MLGKMVQSIVFRKLFLIVFGVSLNFVNTQGSQSIQQSIDSQMAVYQQEITTRINFIDIKHGHLQMYLSNTVNQVQNEYYNRYNEMHSVLGNWLSEEQISIQQNVRSTVNSKTDQLRPLIDLIIANCSKKIDQGNYGSFGSSEFARNYLYSMPNQFHDNVNNIGNYGHQAVDQLWNLYQSILNLFRDNINHNLEELKSIVYKNVTHYQQSIQNWRNSINSDYLQFRNNLTSFSESLKQKLDSNDNFDGQNRFNQWISDANYYLEKISTEAKELETVKKTSIQENFNQNYFRGTNWFINFNDDVKYFKDLIKLEREKVLTEIEKKVNNLSKEISKLQDSFYK